MQKKLMVLFAFAIFVLVVGWAVTPAQAHVDLENPENCLHKNPEHKHCNGGNGNGDGEPTLEDCSFRKPPVAFCIADVGLARTAPDDEGRPADHYARDPEIKGFITNISSPKFDKILQALPEGEPAVDLCNAFDVLIFNWSSPKIKNLNWQRLLDYMECGGGIIFEDPSNVGALAPDVSTFEVAVHSKGETPLPITLEPVDVLTVGDPLTFLPPPPHHPSSSPLSTSTLYSTRATVMIS